MNGSLPPMALRIFSWPLFMLLVSVVFAWINPSSLLLDPDTLWHIRSGEWIAQHKAVPTSDAFSHTFFGKPWHAHEWLSSLILFTTFQALSWPGLVALAALAFGLTNAVITRFLMDRLAPPRALLIATLVLISLYSHLLARPHVLAMPLLAIWVIECVKAMEQHRTPPMWLAALMILWANLHGSFVLGLVLIGFFALEALTSDSRENRWNRFRPWLVFGFIALAASLITPHHVHGLLFPFELRQMTFALSVISEWRPPNFQRFEPQEAWILGLFFLGWLIKIRAPWARLVLLALIMHQSLAHTRHLALLAIIAPVILALPFQRALAAIDRPTDNLLDRFFDRTKGYAQPLGAVIVATLCFTLPIVLAPSQLKPPEATLPINAIESLKRDSDGGKVLNAYRYGGALIFSGIPVFVDGRADMYGDEFLKGTLEAINGKPGALETLLKKHDIRRTFLEPDAAAVGLLDQSPQWRKLYADQHVVIHVRQHRFTDASQ